jgi:hypothetical protein
MKSACQPPYTPTSGSLRWVGEICEMIGRYSVAESAILTPRLRRSNRFRSILNGHQRAQNLQKKQLWDGSPSFVFFALFRG